MAQYLQEVSFSKPEPPNDAPNFIWETNCVSFLYWDALPRVETKGISKILVRPCRATLDESLELVVNPSVLQYSCAFDFEKYQKGSSGEKKRMALELMHSGLCSVAALKGWDKNLFSIAYETLKGTDLVYKAAWGKPVSAADKTTAQIWVQIDFYDAKIFVVFRRGNQELGQVLVTSVKPSVGWVNSVVGKLKWRSKCSVRLVSRDGSESWDVRLPA